MLRRHVRRSFAIALALVLSGCAHAPRHVAAVPPANKAQVTMEAEPAIPTAWKSVATADDMDRLSRLDSAWTTGLAEARAAGFAKAIKAEGDLLDPGIALPRAAPPPGPYQCRMVKLGKRDKAPAFEAFKAFDCYIEAEGDLLTIVKSTGSERPAGRLWSDGDARMIFLGTIATGTEEASPYAADPRRDIAGRIERVAPFRWRLVMPFPRRDASLDVLELVPITPAPKGGI